MVADDFRLKLLAPLARRGNRDLGDEQRQVELAELLVDVEHHAGTAIGTGEVLVEGFTAEIVVLEADAANPSALGQQRLDLVEVPVRRRREVVARHFVDHQRRRFRKQRRRLLERPSHVIAVGCEQRVALRADERLVDHVEDVDLAAEAAGNFTETLLVELAQFAGVLRQPRRIVGVPEQRMPFEGDPIFCGPGQESRRGRPAPDVRGGLFIAQLALGRLRSMPVERHGGEVEQLHEALLVPLLKFVRLELAQHEGVAAEKELVTDLGKLDLGAADRLAGGVDDRQRRIALAVLLYVAIDPRVDRRVAPLSAVVLRRGRRRHGGRQAEQQGSLKNFHGLDLRRRKDVCTKIVVSCAASASGSDPSRSASTGSWEPSAGFSTSQEPAIPVLSRPW